MARHRISTNTAEVRMRYLLDGEKAENVYHVHRTGPWDYVELGVIAEIFAVWEETNAKHHRSVGCALYEVIATDLTSLDATRYVKAISPPVVGLEGGEAPPNNVTIALKANINKRGRGRNGRNFWIGLTNAQITGNQIDDVAATALLDDMSQLIADVNAGTSGNTLVVPHWWINKVYQVDAPTDPIITYSLSDLTTDSQVDRLPNHKRRRKPRTP